MRHLPLGLVRLAVACALGQMASGTVAARLNSSTPCVRSVRSDLVRIERASSLYWNTSRTVMLLGAKAMRDFGVYNWAFQQQGFTVIKLRGPLNLHPSPSNQAAWGSPAETRLLQDSAAILCHSLKLAWCFTTDGRENKRARALQSPPPGAPLTSSTAVPVDTPNPVPPYSGSVYVDKHASQKINRMPLLPQLLTSKDAMCATLKSSGLSSLELLEFTFPCWTLPHDVEPLLDLLRAARFKKQAYAAAAASTRLKAAVAPPELSGSRATIDWTSWILKPSKASEGKGIEVLNLQELIGCIGKDRRHRDKCPRRLRLETLLHKSARRRKGWDTAFVVQPYLQEPLLYYGRKWDMRTYVLCSNVLPMRLYVFGEAIVRYASTQYSANSSAKSSVLTNTFVGKAVLGAGVAPVTGSVASLGEGLLREHGSSDHWIMGVGEIMLKTRRSIGQLFLTAEPQIADTYAKQYPNKGFRCQNCYHFLGVDLIADTAGAFRVIEVNISPDMSLSLETCRGVETCVPGKKGGSPMYDHTKRAVGYNTVRTMYARKSSASKLAGLLAPHADTLAAEFPLLLERNTSASRLQRERQPSKDSLALDVVEYLLDAVREGEALGCFLPVYPSSVLHDHFEAHMRKLWSITRRRSARAYPSPKGKSNHTAGAEKVENRACSDANSSSATGGYEPTCESGFDFARRLQFHRLVRRVLFPADPSQDSEPMWRPPFSARCESMLAEVLPMGPHDQGSEWARRKHIFQKVGCFAD